MSATDKNTIIADITTNIRTGLSDTRAVDLRAVLYEILDSYANGINNTGAIFTSTNPILLVNQIGIESDSLLTNPKFKIGNGVTNWNSLPYASSLPSTLQQVTTVGNTTTNDIVLKDGLGNVVATYSPTTGLSILNSALGNLFIVDKVNNLVTLNDYNVATEFYVNNKLNGLSWKTSVLYSTTTGENLSLVGLTATIDGVSRTLLATDRILVKNQTNQTQNGIYNPSTSPWRLVIDANTSDGLLAATVYVRDGNIEKNRVYSVNVTPIVLGATNITFALIAGVGNYTNGTFLSLIANKFDVDFTTFSTTQITEGTNLYFTLSRVLASLLTGLNTALTGTITATDTVLTAFGKLQNGLATKQNNLGFTPENVANKDASNGYTGLTLFKINFKNALNTFTSFFTNSNTASRTYTFQDRDGTIADNTDLATKENSITAGTTSQYFRGDKTFQILDKTAVGLNNVDNVSDINKPISAATQTALNTKLIKSGDTITGDIDNSGTGFFKIPNGTTAQRPATPANGMHRYNTDNLRNEFYSNGLWRNHARLDGDVFTGAISATNLSNTNTGDETASRIATINHGATFKSTLVDADEITGQDSATAFGLIRTTALNIYNYVKTKTDTIYRSFSRTAMLDANYTVLTSDNYIATTVSLTAPRTITLDGARPANKDLVIADDLQTITDTNVITISVQVGKTLNGVLNGTEVMITTGEQRRIFPDGNGNWSFDTLLKQKVVLNTYFPLINGYKTDFDPMLVIARTVDYNTNQNAHGFVDATVFSKLATNYSNNGFTDNGIMTNPVGGTGNYDHHSCFQSQFEFRNYGGTTGYFYFCADYMKMTYGTLINRYGYYFYDSTGAGTINNQYAFYCPTITKGALINEAIHVESNDSYFGGKIKMVTTSGAANVESPRISFYHATSAQTSYISDTIINNTSQLNFNVANYNFTGFKQMLTLRGDDTNTNQDFAGVQASRFYVTGNSFFGSSSITPTARMHISAGTSVANSAPIQVINGVRETVARGGLVEYENNWYKTNNNLVRYSLGGGIKDFIADVASPAVLTESDIYTYTTLANTLAVNGDKIDAEYGLQLTATGGLTKQLRVYFAGVLIFDSGGLSLSVSTDFCINALVIRDSATSVRCVVTANTTGASTNAFAKVTKITGLTLSNTNILKVTGTVGTGAVAGDITGILGMVEVKGAS